MRIAPLLRRWRSLAGATGPRLRHPLRLAWTAPLAALLLAACARLPGEAARGTPAEAAAGPGFALLSLHGHPLGSAVAIAGPDGATRLLTNAHVLPEGAVVVTAMRGDGVALGPVAVLARSATLDLTVLAAPPGGLRPVPPAPAAPRPGQPVWLAGAPRAGPAVAPGEVVRPALWLPAHGPGFTARAAALLGYSGGPAVDGQGRLLGLVTALPQPGAAPLLAALSGVDLDGLARGPAGREVFILSAPAALAEAARIAP